MEQLYVIWPYLVAFLTLFVTLAASGHAVIYKRDSRSAVFWAAVIWMVPVFGAILYLTFGVNRIRRRVFHRAAIPRPHVHREASPAVLSENPERQSNLLQVGGTVGLLGLGLGLGLRPRHNGGINRGEDADDGNHDKELNQSESSSQLSAIPLVENCSHDLD